MRNQFGISRIKLFYNHIRTVVANSKLINTNYLKIIYHCKQIPTVGRAIPVTFRGIN